MKQATLLVALVAMVATCDNQALAIPPACNHYQVAPGTYQTITCPQYAEVKGVAWGGTQAAVAYSCGPGIQSDVMNVVTIERQNALQIGSTSYSANQTSDGGIGFCSKTTTQDDQFLLVARSRYGATSVGGPTQVYSLAVDMYGNSTPAVGLSRTKDSLGGLFTSRGEMVVAFANGNSPVLISSYRPNSTDGIFSRKVLYTPTDGENVNSDVRGLVDEPEGRMYWVIYSDVYGLTFIVTNLDGVVLSTKRSMLDTTGVAQSLATHVSDQQSMGLGNFIPFTTRRELYILTYNTTSNKIELRKIDSVGNVFGAFTVGDTRQDANANMVVNLSVGVINVVIRAIAPPRQYTAPFRLALYDLQPQRLEENFFPGGNADGLRIIPMDDGGVMWVASTATGRQVNRGIVNCVP